ncbi:SDR family oxidoreductase [Reichenbachiella versicolor]|uniref:SDR family oxidoreductase n=1 Tax=Reichenbachiella versicolor TaxID=1821036 RepID=UPI000D6E4851|nr:SDR family oxidoreductase [Reichenbachiella versicolor]
MNKTAVITGGTKGIGKAIIQKLAQEGFDIITCSRSWDELEELKAEIEEDADVTVHIMRADLSLRTDTDAFIKTINQTVDRIDILVNNTGVFLPGELTSEPEGNLELMIQTNLYSAYHLTRGVIDKMKDRKSGDIFNMCSIASITAYPNGGSYSISKFAMYGMSKVLREELKPFGIRVVSVLPGATLTNSWSGIDIPEERFMKASDVADAVWGAHSLSKNSVVEEIVIRPQLGDL